MLEEHQDGGGSRDTRFSTTARRRVNTKEGLWSGPASTWRLRGNSGWSRDEGEGRARLRWHTNQAGMTVPTARFETLRWGDRTQTMASDDGRVGGVSVSKPQEGTWKVEREKRASRTRCEVISSFEDERRGGRRGRLAGRWQRSGVEDRTVDQEGAGGNERRRWQYVPGLRLLVGCGGGSARRQERVEVDGGRKEGRVCR
ncbi:hypothetical protein R3P38DRAFT_2768370 [Favolaschia claudopus]|uniref:Uncharacterized protein n=1 Tax=Favolaschia claudopus TaxID=2862362 RepID=A0AAW0CXK0_9AGAR